ncbi:RNA-directed DNA polymerase, partial [Paraclostridium sordellii]|uniref:RNA-directed DNA polymerase n=1 Tax=Paraclostridium sordellii TaxID=1505 RepID=UPI0022E5B8DF
LIIYNIDYKKPLLYKGAKNMINYDIDKLTKDILYNGLFSEYLPSKFNLLMDNFDIFQIPISTKNDFIEPYKYTMSRFSENDKRRIIYLPEISSYINSMKYIKENNFINEFIEISINSNKSFSKLLQDDGTLSTHDQIYGDIDDHTTSSSKSTFISNIIKKLNIAKGAKGVLYLDISNFFGNIYTHIFPAIMLGYEETMNQFKINEQEVIEETSNRIIYKKYRDLDKEIRSMNGNRTNGILTGPIISKLISEVLLVKIDEELTRENINFSRFVDDYEVYIYDDKQIEKTTNIISDILNKYYLSLNHEKTKYIPFPYYQFENLEKIIESYNNFDLESYELMELFNTFFQLEANGTKGAIRYLIKSINHKSKSHNTSQRNEIFITYLLNVLVNDTRSLTKVCEILIQEKDSPYIDDSFKCNLLNLLVSSIDDKKDLEVIWLLYLSKNLGINHLDNSIVKKIITSKNELAIIILMYEFEESISSDNEQIYIETASSWILLYELFLTNKISKGKLKNRLHLNNNLNFYNQLKRKKFSFYNK